MKSIRPSASPPPTPRMPTLIDTIKRDRIRFYDELCKAEQAFREAVNPRERLEWAHKQRELQGLVSYCDALLGRATNG